jgi:hypothetical protein
MSAPHSLAPRPPASLETVHNILGSLVARYRKEEVLTWIRQIRLQTEALQSLDMLCEGSSTSVISCVF